MTKESPSFPIALYGAQMVAVRVYFALKQLYPHVRVISFLVTDRAGNPESIDHVPVVELKDFGRTDLPVLIAAPEVHHAAIEEALKAAGISQYECLDSRREARLLERFYGTTKEFVPLRSYPAGENRASVSVYMSKFYRDRALAQTYDAPGWVCPIQAGAELTDVRIAELCDNTGENISAKNPNYCELTASYWIGKHGTDDYLGLYHYRRVLDVAGEDLTRIRRNEIDVILPYPSIHCPDVREHHKRYIREEDWEAMLQALGELEPEYAEAFAEICKGQYLYNFNILIAKKEIFREYCDFLFPILARTEELSEPKGWERRDRYIGYLGESLTTLFFLYNRKRYRIAHTGCFMLI